MLKSFLLVVATVLLMSSQVNAQVSIDPICAAVCINTCPVDAAGNPDPNCVDDCMTNICSVGGVQCVNLYGIWLCDPVPVDPSCYAYCMTTCGTDPFCQTDCVFGCSFSGSGFCCQFDVYSGTWHCFDCSTIGPVQLPPA